MAAKEYTTKQAAEALGLADSRIRQICRWNRVGVKRGRDWFLSESDLRLLRNPDNRRKK